jgi:hypothetical protein
MTEPRSVEEILQTLRSLVNWDVRSLFDERTDAVRPPSKWPAEASLAVTGVTSRELYAGSGPDRILVGVERTLRFSDRIRALHLAMQEAGLFAERIPPPADPAEMTDAELIRTVEYHVLEGHTASKWETMSDAQIDHDFSLICAAYDARRPGARQSHPEPPQRPRSAPAARALPCPRLSVPPRKTPRHSRPQRLRSRSPIRRHQCKIGANAVR